MFFLESPSLRSQEPAEKNTKTKTETRKNGTNFEGSLVFFNHLIVTTNDVGFV